MNCQRVCFDMCNCCAGVEKSPFIKVHRVTDPFVKSVFTVVEMVFASLVVGKLRLIMFLSQSVTSSVVLGLLSPFL